MTISARQSAAGFTLFEMIVVMVITSLMGAVLMQGFGLILATRLSVTNAISNLQEVVLSQNIPVDPLRGLLPDFKSGPSQFRGTARSLSGQTLRPLLSAPGAPTAFTMTLESVSGETVLVYEEPGRPKTELARWPGEGQSFRYRDLKGPWQVTWPQPESTSQTPWMIWIDVGPTLAPLIASVAGSHSRVMRLQDSPFGVGGASPFAQ
jgi:prepilin-type N-terminal cleavage/methylation domain-containing protein